MNRADNASANDEVGRIDPTLEPELVELNDPIEGLTDLTYLTLRDNVTLSVKPIEEDLFVRVDAGQLESAIINTCLDAAQAVSDSGQITITLASPDGEHAVMTAEDTGAGMAPNVLAHAIEPFFSARRDGKDGAGARHGLRVHSPVQWRRTDRIGGGARHDRTAYSSAHRPDRRVGSTFASLAPDPVGGG